MTDQKKLLAMLKDIEKQLKKDGKLKVNYYWRRVLPRNNILFIRTYGCETNHCFTDRKIK